jgi:hypothetical protein
MTRVLLVLLAPLALSVVPASADTITSEVAGNVEGTVASDSDSTSSLLAPIAAEIVIPVAFPGTVTAQAAQEIGALGAKGAVAITGATPGGIDGAIFSDGTFGSTPDGHHLFAINRLVSTAVASGPHAFSILLTGSRLQIFDFAGAGVGNPGRPIVRFEVVATLHQASATTTIFESAAELRGGRLSHTLTEVGQDLGGTFFGTESIFGYDFDPFATQIDLGFLDAGDFVEYSMSVAVSAAGFELGGLAVFGDPNDLDGLASTGGLLLVPEPGSLAMLLLGTVLLRLHTLAGRTKRTL